MHHAEHYQIFLLYHIKSHPELIRNLEHSPFHYLIHNLLLWLLVFFKIKTVFRLYVAFKCPSCGLYIFHTLSKMKSAEILASS